jgi:hypothetical protein
MNGKYQISSLGNEKARMSHPGCPSEDLVHDTQKQESPFLEMTRRSPRFLVVALVQGCGGCLKLRLRAATCNLQPVLEPADIISLLF